MDEIIDWLVARLALEPSIESAYVFGSALSKTRQCNDIDIVIVFSEWKVRQIIVDIRTAFRKRFGLNLHVQGFNGSQNIDIVAFLRRQHALERCK